jgi:glyoxylase-like metal-dependent hydrolase (beta-lactamase superfamily II)
LAAFALLALSAGAQAQGTDYSKVQITTTKVAPNFYTLEGSGGMIGVLAGPDGVLMVDSQFAPLTDKIVAAVKQITSSPIRFLIDTHVHPDHTGGNENLGKLGVTIFAREELRGRLAKSGTAPAGLPVVTYSGKLTFHLNGERVELIPVPAAHTDGDTMVYFPDSKVLMTGDFYRSLGYPNIDLANGGSLKGMLAGMQAIADLTAPDTKIIPGHGATVDRTAVIAQRDMILAIRDKVAALVQQGKTQEEVVAAHPTADYDAKVPTAATTSARFIGQLYSEIKAGK